MKAVHRPVLIAGLAGLTFCSAAFAQPTSGGAVVPIPPSTPRVDSAPPVIQTAPARTTGPSTGLKRRIELIVPFKERGFYIGDIAIGISPDGSIDIPVQRVIELLNPIASQDLIDRLRALATKSARIALTDLNAFDLNAGYDPALLEVTITLPLQGRQRHGLQLYDLDRMAKGQFVKAAPASLWLTWRTSFDYINQGAMKGSEWPAPSFDLTSGLRLADIAVEAGARVNSDSNAARTFERDYTRLVYDMPDLAMRMTFGDLRPGVVGYQTSPDMAGISLVKSYSVLQPGRNIRPRGMTSFALREPGAVDVLINGQIVRRLNLDVGTYDLRDFPLTAGQNNVQLVVEDRSGRRELYSYQQFYDLNLLESGLEEFQLAAGIPAPYQNGEQQYQGQKFVATGFYRRGLSDFITLGINAQGQQHAGLIGLESVLATPFGILGVQTAGSQNYGHQGWAILANYQYQFNPSPGGHRWSAGVVIDARSPWFAAPGDGAAPKSDVAADMSVYFNREITPETSINLDGAYIWKRNGAKSLGRARAAIYQRIGNSGSLGLEGRWNETLNSRHEFGVYLTLSWRFGTNQYVRASYDSTTDSEHLAWQSTPSSSYGDWALSADAERANSNVAINANAYRQWNRLETSLSHSASFDEAGTKITDERTSLRLAGSVAFADGAVALGRPIYDSFAIVEAHKSLGERAVRIDPRGDEALAESDLLGPALISDLSAYSRRTLVVDVDNLPTGYNLDSGSFDVLPSYHSGYRLTVGSDFFVSVIGTLVDRDGVPVSLLVGRAYQVEKPDDHPVTLFTDRKGRFAATGLKPGMWRIEIGDGALSYDLVVGEGVALQRLPQPLKPRGAAR